MDRRFPRPPLANSSGAVSSVLPLNPSYSQIGGKFPPVFGMQPPRCPVPLPMMSTPHSTFTNHRLTPHQHSVTPSDHRLTPHQHSVTPSDHRLTPHQHSVTPSDHRLTPHQHSITPSDHRFYQSSTKYELPKQTSFPQRGHPNNVPVPISSQLVYHNGAQFEGSEVSSRHHRPPARPEVTVNRSKRDPNGLRYPSLSLLSYNVLSQDLIAQNMYLYDKTPPDWLRWEYRRGNLVKELINSESDVRTDLSFIII